jgi:hypothetical protein
VEVKSGYGLTLEDELKTLHVIAKVASIVHLRLVPTFLGAHEIPLEARATADGRSNYISLLVHEMIPRVARQELARFADVFCAGRAVPSRGKSSAYETPGSVSSCTPMSCARQAARSWPRNSARRLPTISAQSPMTA